MPGTGRPPGPGRGHKRKIGHGSGWGGPARGEGSAREALPLIGREREQPTGEAKSMGRKQADARADEMRAVLYAIATDAEAHAMVRVHAADKLLDRLEGKAVATNVSVSASSIAALSDAELAAELARLEREARDAAARVSEAGGDEPAGDVPPVH